MKRLWLAAVLVACGGKGDEATGDPDLGSDLQASPQTLVPAMVEQQYTAQLVVSGGEPPYSWDVPNWERLPGGLELTPAGALVGVASQAGDHDFIVVARDSAGREQDVKVALQVGITPIQVKCGDTYEGSFTTDGYGGSGIDFDKFTGHDWMGVVLEEGVTRYELVFEMDDGLLVYTERPSELIGSWELGDDYYATLFEPTGSPAEGVGGWRLPVDAGTRPSLSSFDQELLPFFVVGSAAGDYSVTVECSEGPIFERLLQYPIEQGLEMQWDYDVFGSQADVRIWTDDPLPRWMQMDEFGRIEGNALQEGTWEITINAEDAEGNVRSERTLLGIYDPIDLECGETLSVNTVENYYDGEFAGFYDPKGYSVFKLDLTESPMTEVQISLSEGDSTYLGTADVDPGWLSFYPRAEQAYGYSYLPAQLKVNPRTYPDIGLYNDAGEIYVTAASLGLDLDLEITTSCSDRLQFNEPALPVFQPFIANEHQLDAIGGIPPYNWAASGLPGGLELSSEGLLSGTTGLIGTHEVSIAVSDREGDTVTVELPLYVGEEDACRGYTPINCAGTVTAELSESFFASGELSEENSVVLCTVNDVEALLGYEFHGNDAQLRVDLIDPGVSAYDAVKYDRMNYVDVVEQGDSAGLPLNPYMFPFIDDYDHMPVLVLVRAYDPGTFTGTLTCVADQGFTE